MDFRTSYKIGMLTTYSAFIMALLGLILKLDVIVSIISFVILVVGMGQTIFFYKCPHCNKGLNVRSKRPNNCPHCHKRLKW